MTRHELMCLGVGVLFALTGCNDAQPPETSKPEGKQQWQRCSPDPMSSNGVTVDYPMTSDTSFNLVVRNAAGKECTVRSGLPCDMPRVAVLRMVVGDLPWVFFENASGNYSRTLSAMNLDDCTIRYRANELLCIDTEHDLIALFDRGGTTDKETAVRLINYENQEKGRIPLQGILCAEHMACLDSAWFTTASLRVSYRQAPDGASSIAELPLPTR